MAAAAKLLLAVLLPWAVHCLAQHADPEFIVEYQPSQLEQVKAQLSQQGYKVLRRYSQFNRLVVSGGNIAAAATASTATLNPEDVAAESSAQIASMGGVAVVEKGGVRSLFPQPIVALTPTNATGDEEEVCTESDGKLGPDADLGRGGEGVPYGIKMVQADDPAMIDISKQYKDKILWCVIDTGLDRTNKEFPEGTSGCIPGYPNNDTSQPFRYCYTWYEDANRHGTHTSGTIGALHNGHGVVGVSAEGAQVYHYNYFGPNMDASDDLEVAAWTECIAELDRRKAATSTPDMKLVISMSYGSTAVTDFSINAISALAAARSDVLWIAAAGNGGDNTTNYPAGYDEVISIAAVDWAGKVADFSTFNPDVELAAPGVQTLSTIPVAMTNASQYYMLPFSRDILVVTPALPEVEADPQFFNKPKVARADGSPAGAVTGPVANCGLAEAPCEDAAGKICLIQRGGITFCEKVLNCVAGGGAAVIIYNRDDLPQCERLSGVSLDICEEAPSGAWPPVITITQKQGNAIRSALESGSPIIATINVTNIHTQDDYAVDLLSGTSMATPTAAGVAGLVWSAHTECTANEIRAALRNTAWRPDSNSSELVRDEHYGYGIVQAAAAHKYLTANPCTGSRLEVAVQASVPGGGPASAPVVGSSITVRVEVKDAATGSPMIGQRLALAVDPSRKAVACKRYALTTNLSGVATTTCKLMAAGKGKITARAISSPQAAGSSASASTTFTIKTK